MIYHVLQYSTWHTIHSIQLYTRARLNIVTHDVLDEKKILDRSKEMNQMLKELDRRFL